MKITTSTTLPTCPFNGFYLCMINNNCIVNLYFKFSSHYLPPSNSLTGSHALRTFKTLSALSLGTNDTTGKRERSPGFWVVANCTFKSKIMPLQNPRYANIPSNVSRICGIVDAVPFVENCHTPATPRTNGTIKFNVNVISQPSCPSCLLFRLG